MVKSRFKADLTDGRNIVNVEITIVDFVDENGINFIYSPHLDLAGYGNSTEEAKQSFEIALEEFISYIVAKKTVIKVFKDLGWSFRAKSKIPKKLNAPSLSTLMKDNEYVSDIFDKYSVHTSKRNLELPAVA